MQQVLREASPVKRRSSRKVKQGQPKLSVLSDQSIAVGLLVFFLTLSIVADGGVEPILKSILALLAIFLCVLEVGRSGVPRIRLVSALAQGLLALLTLALLVQSIRLGNSLGQNPIWTTARQSLPDVMGAISVAPEQSLQAIVTLSPVFVFIAVLNLCRDDMLAVWVIKILALIATVAAIAGLLGQFHVFEFFGAAPKQFYRDSLTSFFVNRNTAGTFFGLGTLVCLALTLHKINTNNLGLLRILQAVANGTKMTGQLPIIFMACTVINGMALVLTQSRGAVAATGAGVVLYLLLVSQPKRGPVAHKVKQGHVRRVIKLASGIVVVLIVLGLFAARAVYRQEAEGVDAFRLCTYKSTWQMAVDTWPMGSGFGTFSNLFPSYRDPECSGLWGYWEMAHNFFLEGLSSLGAVFFGAVLTAYAVLIWAFVVGLKNRVHHRYVAALGLSALVLVSIHSMVDFSLQIPGFANFFAVLLAACVAVSLTSRTDRNRISLSSD